MKAAPLSRRRIAGITETLLREFCPGGLLRLTRLDVERFYEKYVPAHFGIRTGYEQLADGVHGFTDPIGWCSAVSVELVDAKDRATLRFGRSTIIHEAGHCVLHARQFRKRHLAIRFTHDRTQGKLLFRQEELKAYESPEWQAFEFAKALLLPKGPTQKAVDAGLTIREMAELVDINPRFVETRLKNLGLLEKVRAF